jgi:hypothetical protein
MIQNLDDVTALEILSTIARSRSKASTGDGAVPWSPELKQALVAFSREFQTKAEATQVSEGELARQALLVLAEDPETRAAIETMAAGWEDKRQKFDFGATLGITAAVLVVLQMHVRFERTRDGKWSLKMEKKPTSEMLLKGLVQKLINFGK